jgi:hypothetical protein
MVCGANERFFFGANEIPIGAIAIFFTFKLKLKRN